MNYSDAERLASVLESQGFKKINDETKADILCAIACSVRQSAVDRLFALGKKWSLFKNTTTILTGCAIEEDKKKMKDIFDIIIAIAEIEQLPQKICQIYPVNQLRSTCLPKTSIKNNCSYFGISPIYSSKTTAYIPIMTGCNNFCSYCAVPYTRGREVSRPAQEILVEIKSLIKKGYKEVTLLGQNVNNYLDISRAQPGWFLPVGQKPTRLQLHTNFPALLQLLNNLSGNFTIKFITSNPWNFTDELIETIAKCRKINREIHLALQSGDDQILKKMNRKYTGEDYLKLVKKIRKKIIDVKISTDIIVGFPGETKKQFQNTIKLCKKIKFSHAYIARYSPRPGTAAAKLKDDVSQKEKKRREKALKIIIR